MNIIRSDIGLRLIAETIIRQLGGNKFIAMTGSRNFLYLSEGGVQLDVGSNPCRVSRCVVRLNADDLYTVTFYRGRGLKLRELATVDQLTFDQLPEVFTRHTGLLLSLTTR